MIFRRSATGAALASAALLAAGCGATPARQAGCPPAGETLSGVWRPQRLLLHDGCRHISGLVRSVHAEQDGDLHIKVVLDPSQRTLLNGVNRAVQHSWLVVEFMPRDGGHLPAPRPGQRIAATGAWVTDLEHGWNELHPVWTVSLNGSPVARSGPQYGGSPATSGPQAADRLCRTQRGARCAGYALP